MWFTPRMVKSPSRRNFMRTAPLAAAAISLPLSDRLLFAAQATPAASPVPFQLFTAAQLAESEKKLQAAPGNDNLFQPATLPFTIVLTTEEKHSAKEFEWHEGRDHIVQILEGSTVYELGGQPERVHNNKLPTEWLAPTSAGATKMTLHKGDMVVIPRGTPHKRSTEGSVTFYLISTTGK
jgi:quercetin dioxygenase-like cupin family protein